MTTLILYFQLNMKLQNGLLCHMRISLSIKYVNRNRKVQFGNWKWEVKEKFSMLHCKSGEKSINTWLFNIGIQIIGNSYVDKFGSFKFCLHFLPSRLACSMKEYILQIFLDHLFWTISIWFLLWATYHSAFLIWKLAFYGIAVDFSTALIKFIYSEKATKFCKISTTDLTVTT